MYYNVQLISAAVANQLNELIPGCPVEDKVLVYSPKDVNQTKSGIIIPGQVKEGIPRKGVVIKVGAITEEYRNFKPLLQTGIIVEYGLYAGKEHQFDESYLKDLSSLADKGLFTVLSINEISYVEPNTL